MKASDSCRKHWEIEEKSFNQINEAFTTLDISASRDEMMIRKEFAESFDEIRRQLERFRGNLKTLGREAENFGTLKDSHGLRAKINSDLVRLSKDINMIGDELKVLSNRSETNAERTRLKQLAREYGKLLEETEAFDDLVIRECRRFLRNAQALTQEEGIKRVEKQWDKVPLLKQQEEQSALKLEIEYNEGLIREREMEIQNIGRASNLINELFQQVGMLVGEQQDLIENIEVNADLTRDTTTQAVRQLERNQSRQKRRTSQLCFLLIFIIIGGAFVLTVLASVL